MFLCTINRNEGAFAKTALVRGRPFVSFRFLKPDLNGVQIVL